MGMKLFVKDDIFWPAENGVYPGDVLNVVLVGGGNKGGDNPSGFTPGGEPGGDSSFGTYAVALGGMGAAGGMSDPNATPYGSGGGGGFIPGSPFQGGVGMRGNAPAGIIPVGNGGGAGNVLGANGTNFGGSGTGHTGGHYNEGGGGYGAGGGTTGHTSSRKYAGNAGQIVYYSHIVTEADMSDGIPITIGTGFCTLENALKTFSASGVVVGVKNVKTPITSPACWGTHGTYKTFETDNGAYGLTPCTQSNDFPLSTSFVKLPGVDKLFTFAQAFPGFNSDYREPIFLCNGYYLNVNSTASGFVVRYIKEEDAGKGVNAVTITYASGQTAGGVSGNDLIVCTSTTTLQVYENWTPEHNQPISVTLSGALTSNLGNTMYLLGTPNGVYQMDATTFSAAASSRRRITNYLTGATDTTTYSPTLSYPQGNTVWVMRNFRVDSATHHYHQASLTESPVAGTLPVTFRFGTSTHRSINRTTSQHGAWAIVPTVGDGIGQIDWTSTAYLATVGLHYRQHGYNNNPAMERTGDGAGGCCMISW